MKPFPAIVMAVFVALALFGVFVFATFTASRTQAIGTVTIWGSMPDIVFERLLISVRDNREDFSSVTYVEVPQSEFSTRLVEAIAAGKGPDLVLFPASLFVKDSDKLQTISYSTMSKRVFQDSFVEGSEIFLTDSGIKGLPLTIDPLVLYWNRTLLSNAGIARPPRYWDEVVELAPRLTKKSDNGSITTSAIALGGWDNVLNAKGILVTLMHQLGSPVVETKDDGTLLSVLSRAGEKGVSPGASATRYYTEFADPVKPHYSWNRSQKDSRSAFLGGTLALYIAPASDLYALRESNPNLNYDVAPVPSTRGAGQRVYAEIQALTIPRGSKNPAGAAQVALILTAQEPSKFIADELDLPSPRRDVELDASANAYRSTFRLGAINSFIFLDPDPAGSNLIFSRMIDGIASGRNTVSEALRLASDELQALIEVQ